MGDHVTLLILAVFALVAGLAVIYRVMTARQQEQRFRRFIMGRIAAVKNGVAAIDDSDYSGSGNRVQQYAQPKSMYQVCRQKLNIPSDYLIELHALAEGIELSDAARAALRPQIDAEMLAGMLAVITTLGEKSKLVYGHILSGHGTVRQSEPCIWLDLWYEQQHWAVLDLNGNIKRAEQCYSHGITVGGMAEIDDIQSCYERKHKHDYT